MGPAMETEEGETNSGRQRYVTARRRMNNANIRTKDGLIRPNEKMRITKTELCFSGPTAYPSNMLPSRKRTISRTTRRSVYKGQYS